MSAVAMAMDPDADRFEETDQRLTEWGRQRRDQAQALGLPTVSNFAQIAAHVRRQEREERKLKRKEIRRRIREQRKQGQPVDCREVSQARGDSELDQTALGKQTQSRRPARARFSSSALTVEAAVRSLPGWMQTPLYRTYVYRQPHRIAALELKLHEPDYRSRWRAAVTEVGRLIAIRQSGAVR